MSDSERIKVMLACEMPDSKTLADYADGNWVAEEKFDGHRALLFVTPEGVAMRSRSWKIKKNRGTDEQGVPKNIVPFAKKLAYGIYDGELMAPQQDGKSWNVPTAINAGKAVFHIFDILKAGDEWVTGRWLISRRNVLWTATTLLRGSDHWQPYADSAIRVTKAYQPGEWDRAAKKIKERGGEGLVLKHIHSTYVHERSDMWLKVKWRAEATLKAYAFKEGTRAGVLSIALLVDAEGNKTSVKVRNEEYVRAITKNPTAHIGRDVEIEYQVRTPDGSYRHPMMKRFAGDD